MYRVTVTALEKFRRYMSEVSTYDTEEALIACIKGIFEGNAKTSVGQAMHKIIEGRYDLIPDRKRKKDLVKAQGIIFSFDQASPVLAYRKNHPRSTSEINIQDVYQSSRFPIMVVGRVDAIEGIHVRDAKFKFRNIDLKEYTESCQWKFYLDILNCNVFWYDLFEIKRFDAYRVFEGFAMDSDVEVIAHDPLQCIAYNHMREELTSIINDFLDYVESRDLFSFLKPANEYEHAF